MQQNAVSRTVRFYNMTLALMSLLNGYAFIFMRGFSLAMMISSFFAVFSTIVFAKKNERFFAYELFLFVCYACASSLLTMLFGSFVNTRKVVFTVFKLLVWSSYILLGGKLFFNYEVFIGYAKKVMLITFSYLIFQYLAHYLIHIDLPASFDFGLIKSNYDNYEIVYQATNKIFRPGSFWTEPGYLGYYYNGFLCICLFGSGIDKSIKNNFYILLTCAGIILSMSTGAMVIMGLILLFKFFLLNKRSTFSVLLIGVIGVTIIGYFILQSNMLDNLKGLNSSFDNTIYKLQHLDSVGRVGGSYKYVLLLSPWQKIFGVGLGNELAVTEYTYFNGIVTLILWVGYVGVLVWFLVLGSTLKKSRTLLQKMMLIVFLIDGFYASLYFGAHSFIYLIFAFFYEESKLQSKEQASFVNLESFNYESTDNWT